MVNNGELFRTILSFNLCCRVLRNTPCSCPCRQSVNDFVESELEPRAVTVHSVTLEKFFPSEHPEVGPCAMCHVSCVRVCASSTSPAFRGWIVIPHLYSVAEGSACRRDRVTVERARVTVTSAASNPVTVTMAHWSMTAPLVCSLCEHTGLGASLLRRGGLR